MEGAHEGHMKGPVCDSSVHDPLCTTAALGSGDQAVTQAVLGQDRGLLASLCNLGP
jgi:hypothetical protein